jgi:uncharacterized protein DUF5666
MRDLARTFRTLSAVLVVTALAACGGGGGNGGTGSATVSQGVITAKGSIFVNGIEYSTTNATIRIDDNPGTESDLKEGMIVRVRGTADDSTRRGVANRVEAFDALEGRIDNNGVDLVNKTITVMGQQVKIEDNVTRLNDDNNVKIFAGANFQPGDLVEINGFPDDNGGLRATRVVKKSSGEFEIKGFVVNLGASSFGLSLLPGGTAALIVNFTTLPAGVVEGSFVEVKALIAPSAGVLTASLIELEDRLGAAGEKVEVEGIVTSVDANITTLVINGQTVLINSGTVFEGGVRDDIAPGVKLEAEGPLNAAGAIVAVKISFRSNIKIEADASLTSASGLTVLGKQVAILPTTRLDNGLPVDGDHVEVRAVAGRDGGLVASRIKILSPSGRAFLQGPVTAFDGAAGTMTIIGTPISTSVAVTEFRIDSDSSEQAVTSAVFFSRLIANVTVVKVRWNSFISTAEVVSQAEIELDD